MAGVTTIGELRHRVTIQYKVPGDPDGAGGKLSETWGTLATVWAKVDPRAPREILLADQIVHRITCLITIRRRSDVTSAMRVSYQGRIFAILGVREINEARHWTELQCEEGAPS